MQCTAPMRKQLASVYESLPQELEFKPLKWGRNLTEPIQCKICLENHHVNECEVYKCRHCHHYHPAFQNCSLHIKRAKKHDSIVLVAMKVKTGLFHQYMNPTRRPGVNKPQKQEFHQSGRYTGHVSQEDSSNLQWRQGKSTFASSASTANFNKQHWKRNRFY